MMARGDEGTSKLTVAGKGFVADTANPHTESPSPAVAEPVEDLPVASLAYDVPSVDQRGFRMLLGWLAIVDAAEVLLSQVYAIGFNIYALASNVRPLTAEVQPLEWIATVAYLLVTAGQLRAGVRLVRQRPVARTDLIHLVQWRIFLICGMYILGLHYQKQPSITTQLSLTIRFILSGIIYNVRFISYALVILLALYSPSARQLLDE